MREYTLNNPAFFDKITITEPTDTNHADNINAAPIQIFQNTLVNHLLLKTLLELMTGCKYDAENEIIDLGLNCALDGEIVMIPLEIGNWEAESETLTLVSNHTENEIIELGLNCVVNGEIVTIPSELRDWQAESETLSLSNQGIPSISGGISGGNIGYILQPATPQRLGGVKIGQGLDIDSDGTISVNVNTSAEKAAALVEANMQEFSNEEIQSLFRDGLTPLAET